MPASSVGTCHRRFAPLKRGLETKGEVTGLAFKILVEDPDDALSAHRIKRPTSRIKVS